MNSSTRLIIIRHGKTKYNEKHLLDGQIDTQLTSEGLEQIDKLNKYLLSFEIDEIYSSPLSRAMKTVEKLAKEKEMKVSIIEGFKEIDCGECSGLTKEEIISKFPNLPVEWKKNTDPPFPKGENLEDVENRAIPILLNILKKNIGKTVLISGHGSLNLALIGYFLKIPHGLRFKIKQSNCCVNELEIMEDDFRLIQLNSRPYL